MKESKAEKTIDIILNLIYWLAIGIFVITFTLYIMSNKAPLILPNSDGIKQIESLLGRYPKQE